MDGNAGARSPGLPPVLCRPDRVAHRDLDAERRPGVARARADQFAVQARAARHASVRPDVALRVPVRRHRRPGAQAAAHPGHPVRADAAGLRALRAGVDGARAVLACGGARHPLRPGHHAGHARSSVVHDRPGRQERPTREPSPSTRRCSTAPAWSAPPWPACSSPDMGSLSRSCSTGSHFWP